MCVKDVRFAGQSGWRSEVWAFFPSGGPLVHTQNFEIKYKKPLSNIECFAQRLLGHRALT
jgi:hypothetical protein